MTYSSMIESDINNNDDSFVMMEVEAIKRPALTVSVAPKHDMIGVDSSMTTTQVCATIQARALDEDDGDVRAPVDIVVALDLSGSMEGNKLELCKQTLALLIRCLSPTDRFGLVTFADDAKVEVPLVTLGASENKQAIQSKIQGLRARGCTNISAAIGLAAQEMIRIENPHNVQSVFLLSDGCANRGVTHEPDIVQLAKACLTDPSDLKKTSTTLHCFGYGSDHDEKIMQALSEAVQGGTYYFVEGDSNVATAFGDALGGMLSVVAQNVMVRIKPSAGAGSQIMEVYHDSKTKESDGSFVVSLGDFYADEKRDILFSVSLATFPSLEHVVHASIKKSYLDTIRLCLVPENRNPPAHCMIARPSGSEVSNADHNVLSQWLRIKTAQDLEVADDMSKKGNISGAREYLTACRDTLLEQPKSPLIQHLAADLNLVLSKVQCESSYHNHGSKMMGRMRQGHRMQRCNEMSESLQKQSTYRTSNKKDFSRMMASGAFDSK